MILDLRNGLVETDQYKDGKFVKLTTLTEIREKLANKL